MTVRVRFPMNSASTETAKNSENTQNIIKKKKDDIRIGEGYRSPTGKVFSDFAC